jgi:hypothetical protein
MQSISEKVEGYGLEMPDNDVDKDYSDPADVSPYAEDIFQNLFKNEKKYRPNPEYLWLQNEITAQMRLRLLSWMGDVVREFKLFPETYQLSIYTLDRFLSLYMATRDTFQLVGITCLLIAEKVEELYPAEVSDHVYISANAYPADMVIEYEKIILDALGYVIKIPLPIDFQRRFSKVAHLTNPEHNYTKYLTEMALMDSDILNLLPSQIAAGATYLTMVVTGRSAERVWTNDMVYYTHYSEGQARSYAQRIQKMVMRVSLTPQGDKVIDKFSKQGDVASLNYNVELPPVTNTAYYIHPDPTPKTHGRRRLPRPYPHREPQQDQGTSPSLNDLQSEMKTLQIEHPRELRPIKRLPTYPPSEWD